jgi:hypothetical protein
MHIWFITVLLYRKNNFYSIFQFQHIEKIWFCAVVEVLTDSDILSREILTRHTGCAMLILVWFFIRKCSSMTVFGIFGCQTWSCEHVQVCQGKWLTLSYSTGYTQPRPVPTLYPWTLKAKKMLNFKISFKFCLCLWICLIGARVDYFHSSYGYRVPIAIDAGFYF